MFLICTGLNAQKGALNLCRWHISDKVAMTDYQLIKKSGIYYFLSNDKENLFVDLKVEDQGVQRKILNEGLTIWINMDEKPVRRMGVRYPTGSQNGNSPSNTIELIGFISEQERHFPADNPDNFRGSVTYNDGGILYYKLVMPIAKLPVRNSKEGKGAMPFTLGIEYGSPGDLKTPGENMNRPPSSAGPHRASELYWINHIKLATSK